MGGVKTEIMTNFNYTIYVKCSEFLGTNGGIRNLLEAKTNTDYNKYSSNI